jgi:hypothetical protein
MHTDDDIDGASNSKSLLFIYKLLILTESFPFLNDGITLHVFLLHDNISPIYYFSNDMTLYHFATLY